MATVAFGIKLGSAQRRRRRRSRASCEFPCGSLVGMPVARKNSRVFLLASTTHHVKTHSRGRDLFAAGAMVLAVVAWGALLALLAN